MNRSIHHGRLGAALLGSLLPLVLAPAASADDAVAALRPITVKGAAIDREQSAYTSTTIDTAGIREERITQLPELFRQVPGMNVLDYGLPGVANAIVIRGFGGGGHGGDLGAVIDGIPLNEAMSHADGYVDFNVVVPLEIDRVTVYKGPVSALYGNFNRGGLIQLDTRKDGRYAQADLSLGSFDTVDAQAALGTPIGASQQLNLAAQAFHSDGFRPQSRSDRGTFSGRWRLDVSPDWQLAVSTRLHRADSAAASYLPQARFDRDPYGIDPNVQNDGAEKRFASLRVDADYALAASMKLLTFAYTTQQDFTRWFTRPVSSSEWRQREESYDRSVYGAGVNLNGRQQRGGRALNWVAGLETFRERTDYLYYDGLDHRQRTLPAISDRRIDLDSVSAFGELELRVHRRLVPTLGLRADRFSGRCTALGAETGSSPCDRLNPLDHLSPKLGLRLLPHDGLAIRASWSEGFALPGGFIKYAASADSLDPNVFRQTEVGLRFEPASGFSLDLAAYRLSSTHEVRTLPSGDYENYGATLRRGLELSAQWQLIETLALSAVYARTDSEVEQNANEVLIGNRVAGVSRDTATLNARWTPAPDWRVDATWRFVGGYAIDAANSAEAASYATLDLGASRQLRTARAEYRLFLEIENLGDRVYAASAARIGGQTVYAPAAPRSFRVGVQFDF